MSHESKKAVYASIVANVSICICKFVTGLLSHSSAMLAEAVHSLIDVADGGLLLYGRHQSMQPPDELHPFGHGKALYYWTLIVALLFFALGGGMSVYQGIHHILHPEPLSNPFWNYIVLAAAALFNGWSFVVAFKQFRQTMHGRGILSTAQQSKDPTLYTLVLEDTGDMIGVAIAFVAVFLSHRLNAPWIDGVGSILIGLLLASIAIFLVHESKLLLLGESADPELIKKLRQVAEDHEAVHCVHRPMTMHLGPHNVLAVMEIEFEPHISGSDLAIAIERLDQAVKSACPSVRRLFIEAQSFRGHA